MSLQTITAESVTALFPVPPSDMPKISEASDRPSFTSLNTFQQALDANAMAIPSTTTDLGHLALVISNGDFTTLNSGIPFTVPTRPASTGPSNPARGRPSQAALNILPFTAPEAIRAYNQQRQENDLYNVATSVLRKLILTNVADRYICKLKYERTLYAQVTPLQLMTHLWDKYGAVDIADLDKNDNRMRAPWNPPTPIETLFEQLTQGKKFAEKGGETIPDSTLIKLGFQNIQKTGLFDKPCEKWRKKPTTAQTWDDFVDFLP